MQFLLSYPCINFKSRIVKKKNTNVYTYVKKVSFK